MGRKLLVIDDETSVTTVIKRIGSSFGLDVRAILDPFLATEAFIDFQPDMVLLDLVMPEQDGIEILEEIMLSGIPTKLVLMPDMSDAYLRIAQDVARFHGTPPLPVLRKPFQRHELALLLHEKLIA